MDVAKTKESISWVVTTQLICAFVFLYAKRRFSLNLAHIMSPLVLLLADCLLNMTYPIDGDTIEISVL